MAMHPTSMARFLALVIAAIAWTGFAINLTAVWGVQGNPFTALWIILAYFTILTNLVVGIAFAAIALRGPAVVHPRLLGGIAVSILLVGVVYALLLSGVTELTGTTAITNVLHHQLTPILVPIYWFFFVPKGTLRWQDPFLWSVYPLAYLVYAQLRGAFEGHFSYYFIDYVSNGIPQVAVTVVVISLCFLAAGQLMVLLDRRLAR